jgi:uncharacterized protein (DUF2267 family)
VSPTARERAAQVIIEATLDGDAAVTKRHGVSLRTLQRWRKALEADDKLAQLVAAKKSLLEANWADEIPAALTKCVAFLRRAAEEANHKDPDAIHSVAGAMKLLSETRGTWKMLDLKLARLAAKDREDREAAGEAVPGGKPPGPGQDGERAAVH